MNILQKLLCGLLCLVFIMSNSVSIFAVSSEPSNDTLLTNEEIALVEKMNEFSEDNVCDDVSLQGDEYIYEGEDFDVTISEEGDNGIVLETSECAIKMELPDEVDNEDGVLSDDGTILFNPDDENTAVGVQILSGADKNESWEAVRVLVEIKNSDASKEYSYKYNLPRGYSLIFAEDWYNKYVKSTLTGNLKKYDYFVPGEVFVIDKSGFVMETVDPAWAYDSNGIEVPTHFEINGNELVQVVEFDENTAFPVIADPQKHPNKTKTYYLTKSQVKKERDKYTGSTAAYAFSGIVTYAIGKAPYIGIAASTISFLDGLYKTQNFNTWDKIYTNCPSNKKVKITAVWRWHGSHKIYYPTGKITTSYVKK